MSWPLVKLGDVFNISSSKRVLQEDWRESGIPFYRAREVGVLSREGKVDNALFIDESMYEEFKLKYGVPQEGDLLITAVGTLGLTYAVTSSDKFYFKDASVIRLSKKGDVDTKYVQYAIKSSEVQRFIQNSNGATVGTYTINKAKDTQIPLPPLETQKKIAAVLEKADQLRKDCQQMEQELNSLAQSVFIDMFGDPVANPKGWDVKNLNSIASVQLGKMLSSKSKQNINPKKYLRNANIQWRDIGVDDLLEMDFNEREMKKFQLEQGDLLVCEGGEIGRCAIWNEQVQDCYYQKALHRVRLDQQLVTPEYLQEYFFWMAKLGGLVNSTNEVTFKHLTAEKMNKLNVPLAPISKQKEFSKIYLSIRSELARNAALIRETDYAFSSLMQKAFKGELNL